MADAYKRFLDSMVIDYEKWHDGVGYDLDALDQLDERERKQVTALLAGRLSDWRDIEALARIGSPEAMAAIYRARESSDTEVRFYAFRHGPPGPDEEREAAILAALIPGKPNYWATDAACNHPTPRIEAALLRCVREAHGSDAYSPAAALFFIHGIIDSVISWDERPFLLRLTEPGTPDWDDAYREFCARIGLS